MLSFYNNKSWGKLLQVLDDAEEYELFGRTIIGPYNNIYCHKSEIRYWRNGEDLQQRIG